MILPRLLSRHCGTCCRFTPRNDFCIMLSLYIHIPFCASKCAYCSFNSLALSQLENSELLITNYVEALKKEIDHYAETLTDKSLKTIYFWWGTPSRIGVERIIDIIEHIKTKFDCEDLAELSIELNPYPEQEVLNFVKVLNKKYDKIARLRYSFGIQSFDDEILKTVGRAYSFSGIVEFLRDVTKLKQNNNVFNFDFIAFGKFQVSKNGFKQLWHEFKREFFQKFLASWYVDSISLYTLEGIKKDGVNSHFDEWNEEKSKPYNVDFSPTLEITCTTPSYYGSDDEIMEEFLILKDMIEDAGLMRYEISNFATAGKASIHNMVYWNMENYLWLGLSASSFLAQSAECRVKNQLWTMNSKPWILNSELWTRWTNTNNMQDYLQGNRVDTQQVQSLNESDILIEEFFLRLRTREWIADLGKFKNILITNYEWLLVNYQKEGLVEFDGTKVRLTDEGMNVYNGIVTDLLEKL